MPEYRKRRRKTAGKKSNLEIMSSSFPAEQLVFCSAGVRETFYDSNGILAQKNRRVGALRQKSFRASALSNRNFIALSSVEKITAAQSVQ
ncbi:MAG: hypothetical protein ABSG40_02225 [Terriglobales bacterium]